ncbi:MAG: helix-turn-helix transcriptional regulator [Acidiferrobacter sp.]
MSQLEVAEKIAQKVIRRRVFLGLSQRDLAKRAGIARGTLRSIEAGSGNVTMANLLAVFDTLDIALDLRNEPRIERTADGRLPMRPSIYQLRAMREQGLI